MIDNVGFKTLSDTLQRRYGELSGEIIVVEITAEEIFSSLEESNSSTSASFPLGRNVALSSTAARPQTPKGSPTSPVTSFQSPPSRSKSLGISLCGNRDLNQMAVLVCGLRPGGIAEKDGRIAVGDQLLEVTKFLIIARKTCQPWGFRWI